MKDDTLGLYNTADLREAARRRLPKGLTQIGGVIQAKRIVFH